VNGDVCKFYSGTSQTGVVAFLGILSIAFFHQIHLGKFWLLLQGEDNYSKILRKNSLRSEHFSLSLSLVYDFLFVTN